MNVVLWINNAYLNFRSHLDEWYDLTEERLVHIALMGITGFPIFGYIWVVVGEKYESFTLRFIGSFLSLVLILVNKSTSHLKSYKGIILFLVSLYWFPFFFGYMTLKNDFSIIWSQSLLASFFITILFAGWYLTLTLYTMGTLLAILFFIYTDGLATLQAMSTLKYSPIYAFLVMFGSYFSRNSDLIKQEKERVLNDQAASIAHELLRPISGMLIRLKGLRNTVQTDNSRNAIDNLIEECSKAIRLFKIFKITATKRKSINKDSFTNLSINSDLKTSLANYPYNEGEENMIIWEKAPDWSYHGSTILTDFVITNLLRNSFQSIFQKGEGQITITTQSSKRYNQLIITDTGGGIKKRDIKKILKGNHSLRPDLGGTGLGFSFINKVMHAYGGYVVMESTLGQYTRVTLYFPVIPHTKAKA